MLNQKRQLIVLAGATASGKTALAARLTSRHNLAIISADSRQVYKGLDIGTGKDLTLKQAMIDVAKPMQLYSVAQYQKQAQVCLEKAWEAGQTPLVAGGTGYYIESLIFKKTVNEVKPDHALRQKLDQIPNEQLLAEIERRDQVTAKRVDPNNRVRLLRAVEILRLTNKPIASLQRELLNDVSVHVYVLDADRSELYKAIDARIKNRLDHGMVEEVQELLDQGVSSEWLLSLGLEYYWITLYLTKKITYEEMAQKLSFASHAYARRQISFFKRWPFAVWGDSKKLEAEISELL